MSKPKISREILSKKAADIFRTKGYRGTSVQDIADACQLSKASVYHHISSKETLALDLVRELRLHYRNQIFSVVFNSQLSGPQRMERFFLTLAKYYQEDAESCLLKKFLGELNPQDGALWDEVKNYAEEFVETIMNFLPEKKIDERRGQAIRIFSLIQGYLLLNKIWPGAKTIEALNRFCQDLYNKPEMVAGG